MTSCGHLLDQARSLCQKKSRPRNTDLKRATSTVYYALFHALAEQFADTLVGVKYRQTPAWVRVYRSLDHGKARQEFKRIFALEQRGVVAQVAWTFIELQELRHFADYDPRPSELSRFGVIALLRRTEAVIVDMERVSPEEWRELATAILLRDRK